jgi:hypothetical protein
LLEALPATNELASDPVPTVTIGPPPGGGAGGQAVRVAARTIPARASGIFMMTSSWGCAFPAQPE